jgi:REP element-mobilizing transposase RayT
MARKPRLFAPGVLYHVIVRGNQRQKTFLGEADYETYLEKLIEYRRRHDITLYAYCLMPNHVHLLLECGKTPLGKFMQGLQQSYTQYYNRRYKKVGHLFQGRYKAILCQKDAYLLELIRYIHLNPVRSKLAKRAQDYLYSGDRAYRVGKAAAIVDPRAVLGMIGGRTGYGKFIRDGHEEGHREEYYEVAEQRFLGDEEFGRALKRDYEEQEPKKRRELGVVVKELAARMKIEVERLRAPSRGWKESGQRMMIAYVLVRRGGYGVKEVAQYFGRDATTISSILSRYESRLEKQPKTRRRVESLARIVSITRPVAVKRLNPDES